MLDCRSGRARQVAVRVAVMVAPLLYASAGQAQEPSNQSGVISVQRYRPPQDVLVNRSAYEKGCPERRGFVAPILDNAHEAWPMTAPGLGSPEFTRRAADVVGRHLARDGLPRALALTIEAAGATNVPEDAASRTDLLRMTGIPVDLLACFEPPKNADGAAERLDAYVLRRLREGASEQSVAAELDGLPFRFPRTQADFEIATEDGADSVETVRLQLPDADYWRGPGDGSGIDIARQLVAAIPSAQFLINIETSHVDALLKQAGTWPLKGPRQLVVMAEPERVEQWAQDNGKAGFVKEPDGRRVIATITPRYASVGEEITKFVPQESFVMDSLAATGHRVIQSSLIFQGGNLIAVFDPATHRRVLLIGEAEVYRNTALGLSQAQVVEAFRVEFGVDDCVILPAVSFHIDFEVSARVIGGRVVAFVNDSVAASRIVLRSGIEALAKTGRLNPASAGTILGHLREEDDANALAILAPSVLRLADANRRFPEQAGRGFGESDTDDPAANFERFLLALDILAAHATSPQDMPQHRVFGAYVRSFQRREADRQLLIDRLTALGWRIVRVPSFADETRSLNYINGVQLPHAYLMPAYGGFYAALDAEATRVFEEAMGPTTRVVPITTAESQRRLGALHCSVAIYPKPPAADRAAEAAALDAPR